MSYPKRIALAQLPTPIEKLERLTRHLGGPEIYVKRDDQTGLATGGNKTRKLELLLAEALAQGCDHLVTLGGPQSNHCRQTAAAAARLGLGCSLVLTGEPPIQPLGNLLLDELLGARVYWAADRGREAVADEVIGALQAKGHRPYLIPVGGSTPLATLAYVLAMEEALAQLDALGVAVDVMVAASSSGGTQAGLVLGAARQGYQGRVLGISIDSSREDLRSRVYALAQEGARLLPEEVALDAGRVEVNADYLGDGYAVVGDLEREAIRLLARTEGLLLDPVYTGRAMGALITLIRDGAFGKGQRILFWHTGGTAALCAFARPLSV